LRQSPATIKESRRRLGELANAMKANLARDIMLPKRQAADDAITRVYNSPSQRS